MQPPAQQLQQKRCLRQQDISLIIKHFSFTIQQRFQEIQKNCNYFTCLNSINYDRSDVEKDILHRYSEYKTSNQHEIKLLEKFVQRVMQIFQFFKQKTEEPEILQAIGERVSDKLRQILKNQSNFHFFVNNRPKTHSTNVKPLGNRSASNDFLSIVGPAYRQQIDMNTVLINNCKKVRTQIGQKKTIEVGKLFKYVFSVLKRGYLIKLRMQKPEKKAKQSGTKELSCIEQSATISVEGTCAILRNCSQKGNKQNTGQIQGSLLVNCGKQKLNFLTGCQNKKQYIIYQKVKNRSVSTNQHSILSKDNQSMFKQSTSKLRELDKKVGLLYDILDIEKYSAVRMAKEPEGGRKQQIKRNSWVDNEIKKYQIEYNKWVNRRKDNESTVAKRSLVQINKKGEVGQGSLVFTEDVDEMNQSGQLVQQNQQLGNKDYIIESFFKPAKNQYLNEQMEHDRAMGFETRPVSKAIRTQQYEQANTQPADKGVDSNVHTIIVCSSRDYTQGDNILADKSSNLMDIDRRDGKFKDFKSRSVKQDRKSLRLNLPNMLTDKSNLVNEPNVRLSNLTKQQKNHRMSQKSQYYLHSYHIDSNDDGSFVPLLPKKEKNSQNVYQTKNEPASIKRKNLIPNFHPLNRCRMYRQKKPNRSNSIIQGSEIKTSAIDQTIIKGKIRNALL